jgi:hypothetical protein
MEEPMKKPQALLYPEKLTLNHSVMACSQELL